MGNTWGLVDSSACLLCTHARLPGWGSPADGPVARRTGRATLAAGLRCSGGVAVAWFCARRLTWLRPPLLAAWARDALKNFVLTKRYGMTLSEKVSEAESLPFYERSQSAGEGRRHEI